MNGNIKRTCCLILALLFIPVSSMAGQISELLNYITAPKSETGTETEVKFSVSALPEFSKQRTEWLNSLLQHLSFHLNTGKDSDMVSILVDGITSIAVQSRSGEYIFSIEPETAYRPAEGEDLLFALSGTETDINSFTYYSDLYRMLPSFYEYFSALPDAFPDACSWSKVNIPYKGYGTAVKRCAISLPEDVFQSDEMAELVNKLSPGPAKDMLSGAVFSGRQRYTLLLDENGQPLKINYTGRAGLTVDSIRNVNIDWRCLRGDSGYKDVLKLTNPAVSGTARKNLTLNQEMTIWEDGTENLTASIETDQVEGRIRTRIICKINLVADAGQISGSISERTAVGSSVNTCSAQIRINCTNAEQYEGTLEIAKEMNKIETNHYVIQFSTSPGKEMPWNAVKSVTLREEDYPLLAEKLTHTFLQSLLPLPVEDLQYILADLPEGWWEQFRRNDQ